MENSTSRIGVALASSPFGIPLTAIKPVPIFNWLRQFASEVLSQTTKKHVVVLFIGYVALVRLLRYRREAAMRKAFGYPDRESLARMTNDEAQQIIKIVGTYEFPLFQTLSLEFGLFKTYGVESISKLLLATRQLTSPENSPKRYEDTAVLIAEFMANPPTSERTTQSIARMNYLHSKYRKSGQISNEDLLYTLSVFVTEPARFSRLYDWRPLNDMEYCAFGLFWKAIGDAMDIKYEGLLAHAETGWRDGVEFADDITAWAQKYEVETMKPSAVSAKPAEALIPIMTYWVPPFMKPMVAECIHSMMNDRIREAFLIPEPSVPAVAITYSALWIRKLVVRHLMLPRMFELRRVAKEPNKGTGRLNLPRANGNYPYYIKPTLWNRWGPTAWLVWTVGGKLPGDDGKQFSPDGFFFEEIGPNNQMSKGKEEMSADADKMVRSGRGGCPF